MSSGEKTVVPEKGTKFGTGAPYLRRDHLDSYCVARPNKPFVLNRAEGR